MGGILLKAPELEEPILKHVVIVGGGFPGLRAARILGCYKTFQLTVVNRTTHHVLQPLHYQVAMTALSPADSARPIRNILADNLNTEVLQASVRGIDVTQCRVNTSCGQLTYD
jgi:NADH:quinone reductase (non-electrogenic)